MRRLASGLLVGVLACGACDRAADRTTTATQTAQPGTQAAQPGTQTTQPSAQAAQPGTQTARPVEPGSGTAVSGDTSRAPQDKTQVEREITIPAGTELPIVLDTSIGSKTSRVEDPVRGHLSRAVSVDGQQALADGSIVSGVVTDATPSAKVRGRAHLAVRFDSITPRGGDERYRIETAAIGRTAAATTKDDAVKIGAPAVGGALIGALIGGGKGAAIGTVAGGGAGTAVVLSTSGKETSLRAGSVLRLQLTAPLTIRMRG
jgi:hypothetical protein